MHELVRQGLSILRGMWQWRWIGLAVAWVVGAVAAVVIPQMPDQYEASARIWVDTDSVLKPLLSGLAVQPNVDQQVSVLSRTLISRPNMEKVSRMADLDHGVKSKEEQDSLVDSLMKTLQIKGMGRDNLYALTYRNSDRERAHRVVQSLTSIFVESSLGDKRKDADTAKQFIDNQIEIYEKKLTEAENRLKQFKLRNLNLDTSDGKDTFGRMREANAVLNEAQLALREAENSRDAFKRQIAGEDPVLIGAPDISTPMVVSNIDPRIEALKRNLDTLLQRFTEQHPDVATTRRLIKELEEQKRQEIAARKPPVGLKSSGASTGANNPVYQQLKVSLADAEANIASLQTRVAEYEVRTGRVKASMRIMPEIEAELTQLNRDYAVHKKNYDSFVARREAAAISGQMDASGVAEFRLIDPPRVTPEPVWPNRPLLFALALVGALAAGIFASFAATQLRGSFIDARSLREAVGLPVLGTVSLALSEPRKRKQRRGLIGFIAGTAALVGSYGAGIVLLLLLPARTM